MRIIVRTDFGPLVGGGHLSRSLVLLHQLNSVADFDARLAVHETLPRRVNGFGPTLPEMIPEGVPPFGLDEAKYWVSKRPDLLVLDGYSFKDEFFQHIEASGVSYGVFDDNGETRARNPLFVVNQNVLQPLKSYQRFPVKTRLFLGPQYALVRESLRKMARPEAPKEPFIFISLGSADIHGLSETVIDSISGISTDLRVAVGPMVSNREELVRKIELSGKATVISSGDYDTQFSQALVMVVTAGSTVWEAGFLGIPCVLLIVADNQLQISKSATQLGIATDTLDFRGELAPQDGSLAQAVQRAWTNPPLIDSRTKSQIGSRSLGEAIALLALELEL